MPWCGWLLINIVGHIFAVLYACRKWTQTFSAPRNYINVLPDSLLLISVKIALTCCTCSSFGLILGILLLSNPEPNNTESPGNLEPPSPDPDAPDRPPGPPAAPEPDAVFSAASFFSFCSLSRMTDSPRKMWHKIAKMLSDILLP